MDDFFNNYSIDGDEPRRLDESDASSFAPYNSERRSVYSDKKFYSIAYGSHYTIPIKIINRYQNLEVLDVSHNFISSLDPLRGCKKLNSLIVDSNFITENTSLPYLPNLKLLWMNRCKINVLQPWLKNLKTSCPNLRILSLMDNPAIPSYFNGGSVSDHVQYRLLVLSLYPNLKHLDDKKITKREREKSSYLYQRTFLSKTKICSRQTSPQISNDKRWSDSPIDPSIRHVKMYNHHRSKFLI